VADADRLVAALRYQQELEDASRPATVNPLMARKAEAIKQNAPAENMLTQYAETMPQNWQQFGQNMAQAYPTPATGASRDQILGAVTQAAMNAGPLMTVYHGSPHRFDKFDASKIGTGEGAQAYGHGLYFAEKPEVARAYQNTLSKYGELRLNDGSKVNVPDLPYNSPEQIAGQLWMNKPNLADAKFALGNMDSKYLGAPKEAIVSELEKLHGKGASLSGSFFKVDLPDEHIAKMLDWDKPLSEQSAAVQALLQKAHQIRAQQTGKAFGPLDMNQLGKDVIPTLGEQRLQQAGIPGIRYLDQGSRAAGGGTSNFVVFDPAHMNIIGRE